MAKTVIFDLEVVLQIQETAEYIEEAFGKNVADKFVNGIFEKARSLSHFPEKGMRSKRFPEVRSIKVSKYNRLYYKVEANEVLVLYLFDQRQDPQKDPYQ